MTDTRFQLVDRIVLPSCEHGVDWGAKRLLLARIGTKALTWTKGHTSWCGRGETAYYPAELNLIDLARTLDYTTLHEGGRLSHRLIAQYAEKIDAFFGCPVAKRINHRFTLIVA